MTALQAFSGAKLFDGEAWHEDRVLLVQDDAVTGIASRVPEGAEVVECAGGLLVPGFVDLQVNGGGGVLLNEAPTLEGIRTIAGAHARFGTTALLPTLITDTSGVTEQAIAAGIEAARAGVPGFLGLHLEGPHLSIARKGAHDPKLIRPMDEADLDRLLQARPHLPHLLVTVAAETVPPAQIARLAEAGIVVSIGHSDAGFEAVKAAVEAGATMATHLFNAMSQLTNREPGVVGAVLDLGSMHAGLIADGIHVHPAVMAAALRAKRGPGKIFLVTDAMSLTGTDVQSFTLNGRLITRKDRALRLEDGTLAGADLTMIEAITLMHRTVGLPLDEALRMASLYPAEAIGAEKQIGRLGEGARADFVHLSEGLNVRSTWIAGRCVYRG